MSAEPGDEDQRRSEEALSHLMERVRNVQDLRPFAVTRREDGRFTYELQKPLPDLSEEEAREAAEMLEELAGLVRERVSRGPPEG